MEVKADGTLVYIKQKCLAPVSEPLGIELLTSIVFFQFKEKYSPVICGALLNEGVSLASFRYTLLQLHTCLPVYVWAHSHPKLSKMFQYTPVFTDLTLIMT